MWRLVGNKFWGVPRRSLQAYLALPDYWVCWAPVSTHQGPITWTRQMSWQRGQSLFIILSLQDQRKESSEAQDLEITLCEPQPAEISQGLRDRD